MTDPTAEDQRLIEALRRELIACAKAGETVTYQDLAWRVPMPGPHAIHRLTALLEDLAREDHGAGRPLLAALAVSRAQKNVQGKGVPGRGFFQLLRDLGRYGGPDQGPEAAACHAREMATALAYWGGTTG